MMEEGSGEYYKRPRGRAPLDSYGQSKVWCERTGVWPLGGGGQEESRRLLGDGGGGEEEDDDDGAVVDAAFREVGAMQSSSMAAARRRRRKRARMSERRRDVAPSQQRGRALQRCPQQVYVFRSPRPTFLLLIIIMAVGSAASGSIVDLYPSEGLASSNADHIITGLGVSTSGLRAQCDPLRSGDLCGDVVLCAGPWVGMEHGSTNAPVVADDDGARLRGAAAVRDTRVSTCVPTHRGGSCGGGGKGGSRWPSATRAGGGGGRALPRAITEAWTHWRRGPAARSSQAASSLAATRRSERLASATGPPQSCRPLRRSITAHANYSR